MKKLNLMTRFGLVSAVTVLLIGLVLGRLLGELVQERILHAHERSAQLVATLGLEPSLTPVDLRGFSRRHEAVLDHAIETNRILGESLAGVRIFNDTLDLVYEHGDANVPVDEGSEESLAQEALRGVTTTKVVEGGPGGGRFNVFVPLRFEGASLPVAALELSLPYGPIAAEITDATNRFYLALAVALLVLYLVLFRIVARASRSLREQALANEHQALHDVLTGLANRALFHDRVRQSVLLAEREGLDGAVMIMDLDRFKEINDTLGHPKGDTVLREVARRLSDALRETDTVARLGGDEFAVLVPHVQDPASVVQVVEKIQETLDRPFVIQGLALDVRASVGISFFPRHGNDVDTLIQRADVAMYLAKASHSRYEIYAAHRDQHSPGRLALLTDLRRALDDGELLLHYQPKIDLKTGAVTTVESLVRWNHPARGMIQPADFLPLAEHTGLIEPLTMYVLDRAMKQCAEWREAGLELRVAVNLSPRNLLDLNFPDYISRLMRKWNLPPSCLQLEITESSLLSDPTRVRRVLEKLSEMSVNISIDDFGTGSSSLAHLRDLPVGELKIDGSFVMNMEKDEGDAVIVRSTIDLGRNLGLKVVAEGVENESTWRVVSELGCDLAQGFFRSRPMPPDQIPHFLDVLRPAWRD
jgi:diguanylate cyclase (GGDEF)-like protein